MRMKKFGNTGLVVSELCLGAMTFGGSDGIWAQIASVGQTAADELIRTAIDGGVNFFDTANVYSGGRSEQILGQSLRNVGIPRDQCVLATKVLGRAGPGHLEDCLAQAAHLDRLSKGRCFVDAWIELERLLVMIAQPKALSRAG